MDNLPMEYQFVKG